MKGKVLTSWSLIWLLATVLLIAAGALNLSQRAFNQLPPTDGVSWVQREDGIYADKVKPNFAASRAGISAGDKLIGIGFEGEKVQEITLRGDVVLYLETAGVGGNLTYFYQRPSYSFANNFYYADLRNIDSVPRWTSNYILLTVVGCIWLIVGIFLLFKQGSRSPFILHFATLCLAAFVFHVYNPLGAGEDFDLGISLLDNLAFAFFAPLFLHFCLRYPVRSEVFEEDRWKTIVLYVPALLISASFSTMALADQILPVAARDALYRFIIEFDLPTFVREVNFYHFVAGISLGAGVLCWRFFKNRKPLVRQRLKWAMWGTIVAVVPILLYQTVKRFIYLSDDGLTAALTILPLALIPLSFGHSVVRYRLMDVDVVVRRAFVYALTTVTIAMMIGAVALGLVFLAIGNNLSSTEIALRGVIAVVAMGAIIMLSEPLKNFLQERVERYFYGEKYDLRRGLLDFGKTLSASTALQPLLDGLTLRLQQVLDVEKVAVFIEDDLADENYVIAKSVGLSDTYKIPKDFKTMIRQKSAKTGVVRADEFAMLEGDSDTKAGSRLPVNGNGNVSANGNLAQIIRQELHYYVPCVVRGRMVAVIGLGRARDGSLLSSEDIGIIQTISGYVAVAIENSLLYQEQETRANELALLKEFNESIVESVNVGLIAVDETGLITRCNTSFEQMFGFSRAEAVGRQTVDVFESEFAESLERVLGKSSWHLTDIRNAYKLETSRPDGQPLILNVAIAPLRSPEGPQKGAIVVLENVTSRVKLEEGLQQNEKLTSIGLLAAGVAHEVNTPLTGVSSYTQMLLGMIDESDPKHELLQKVHKQTERATNIVGNLLNFSRAGNSGEFTEVDVNKLLDDTLQLLEPQIRKSNVEIVKSYATVPPRIEGNPGKLQQVFTNIIINAQDAILNEGKITLETSVRGDSDVVIRISDTGEGIDPDNLSKIYDPFFTTKGVGSGTGLGMAVSYGIVQEHSGSIDVISEKGVGTTFELVFPFAAQQPHKIAS
ncbi:MAG: PAS domain S-box protein [Acidobacteria bacterium]|nr:MAG: PAS domain S-box protein [Acidobacteriota bacterium]REK02941.1 MAG: PAS domain S-box protein [Acidobacteriota bacterium]REK13255.1 MAG: PAS domain S-box protein [Acidobacteriota bacterium]REK41249.1 MAG: PAS domain S-box protein [Acidobacteriota bacterium]